ncbi:MAG: ATP-dependent helicase C-terminal domain-containing protein [Bacteriovoracaceae bacterium]
MKQKITLPIDSYLDEIVKAGQIHSTVLLKASPGSGKTTRLPWKIAQHFNKKVLVLEPRRLAAKLAAQRIADEEILTLGKEVGYHFRLDKNYSETTKLIFYTEGTFLKKICSDPQLNEVDVVILDEFHERHLETDSALAYLRSLQKTRKDLRLILMSATLDEEIQKHFDDSKLIEIYSPPYRVDIEYLPNQPSILNQSLEVKIKNALDANKNLPGDILVFVPGMREMLRIQEYLGSRWGQVHILHGDLSKEEQAQVLEESNLKKIILATNIAESSVTIPGIKLVIDSGIQRTAFYSHWNGLKLIKDFPITKSSAIQRAGRAGRTSDGKCLRLYSEQDFQQRETATLPEILKSDLTDTYLWGLQLSQELQWLTPPPLDRWQKAQTLCYQLGATTQDGQITPIGEQILNFPLNARLARVLLAGADLEKKLKSELANYVIYQLEEDQTGSLKRRLQTFLNSSGNQHFPWERCVLTGFIDQVAKYRKSQHDFIHYSGKTIKAHHSLKDLEQGFYLILNVTQKEEAMNVLPIEEEWLYEMDPFPFSEEHKITINESIKTETITKIGSLVIDSVIQEINWNECSNKIKNEIILVSQKKFDDYLVEWKNSDFFLKYDFWARTFGGQLNFETIFSVNDYFSQFGLNWNDINSYFENELKSQLDINLDKELPSKIKLGKKEVTVHYPQGLPPFIESYIQDFYGTSETPSIASGKIALTLKLLGPHKRPIQVTKDLKNFWCKTYHEMLKEWQREYPKHYWPLNPEKAAAFLLKHQAEKS